ncbi:FAD-binding protein [Candidatus Babeliales bacterium]|nr:FAD-binding protein [Candidatus Babeliales bacterium]
MKYGVVFGILLTTISIACSDVTDFGKLYPSKVHKIIYPTTTAQVQQIVSQACAQNKKVSVAGARHSQGGQSNASDSVNIDMLHMNKLLELDTVHKIVRVQAGMSWEQLQDILQQYGLSVKVMQASNVFSIGGSVAVNAHGRDPHYGSLIETVQALKIVDCQGTIKELNRQKNPELFSLVVGGYGLLGIIVEVELSVTDNCVCEKKQQEMSYKAYVDYLFKNVLPQKNIQLHYARLVNIPGKDYLKRVLCIDYIKKKGVVPTTPLPKEGHVFWNQMLLRTYRKFWSRTFNNVRWYIEERMTAPWENVKVLTRNHVMRPYVHSLEGQSKHTTDLLQEYFIPAESFEFFVEQLKRFSEKYRIKLLNVTLRWTPRNTESFLSYSKQDTIAFVLYFTTPTHERALSKVQEYTRALTDACLQSSGSFYLPYQRFATESQMQKAYPNMKRFIKLKNKYDSCDVFTNNWYRDYILPMY